MALVLGKQCYPHRGSSLLTSTILRRTFTSHPSRLSGHNRWSTIRHDKAKNDKAKSKERQVVVKEISNATQRGLSRRPTAQTSWREPTLTSSKYGGQIPSSTRG